MADDALRLGPYMSVSDHKQVVPAAPTGPPVSQPMGPPVVYTATGGAQGSQVAGMSQQSMCAGVPPTGMVPQWGTAVVDPGML